VVRRPPISEQVVVIVGASSGLGRQLALDLAREGARLVVASRRLDVLTELAGELRDAGAADALPVRCDIASDEDVHGLIVAATSRFGRIDTVFTMPGIAIYAPVTRTTLDEYRRMTDVLFLGYVRVTKAVLPVFEKQRSGVLVQVASALGKGAVPLQSGYTAAKHAVVGFTRTLQMEARHEPFQVCLALPGSMATPLQDPHARSKMGFVPKPVPPVVHPHHVSKKLVRLCTHPRETLWPDLQSWFAGDLAGRLAPRLMNRIIAANGVRWQLTSEPEPVRGHDNVDAPMPEGTTVLGSTPPTTTAVARRLRRPAVVAAAAVAVSAAVRRVRRS
jgi:NAD(P)-dependent dehydrogenase (short-subunit alcohol dehydrogenase family)